MAIIPGVGFMTVLDTLMDVSYALFEPVVDTTFSTGIAAGVQTVATGSLAMYVGCQLVVGSGASLEVVTVVNYNRGTSFQAIFANAHNAGEPIRSATFPVRQTTNPFFTQPEMLSYVGQAVNDFLVECPLAISINFGTSVPPAAQNASLPDDCQKPVRLSAYGIPLRETSQSNLDMMNPRWQTSAPAKPKGYFRDKIGKLLFGIWPRANNTTPVEIVYESRGPATVGMADGFPIPDPFIIYIKSRVLEFCYSKNGDQRNPGLAKWYASRYQFGVKLSNMYLEAISDPNFEG